MAAGDVTVALVVAAGRRWEREEEEVLARCGRMSSQPSAVCCTLRCHHKMSSATRKVLGKQNR